MQIKVFVYKMCVCSWFHQSESRPNWAFRKGYMEWMQYANLQDLSFSWKRRDVVRSGIWERLDEGEMVLCLWKALGFWNLGEIKMNLDPINFSGTVTPCQVQPEMRNLKLGDGECGTLTDLDILPAKIPKPKK